MQKAAMGLMPDRARADAIDPPLSEKIDPPLSENLEQAGATTAHALRPQREVREPPPSPPPGRAPGALRALRLFCIRFFNYVTNYGVAYMPSFTVRHFWYRRVMGVELGRGVGVNMRTYVWSYGPRQIRRSGARIGRNSRISHGCTIDLRSGLSIGENVSVSPEVMILAGSHDVQAPRFDDIAGFVPIEDHAWIGARAVILPGITVGRGAVVAAGSVVTKSVAPMSIVAGVPAKSVGVRDPAATAYELDGPLPLFE
jgi:acetyltransferase-like isoleucine patch superfamily enzyme